MCIEYAGVLFAQIYVLKLDIMKTRRCPANFEKLSFTELRLFLASAECLRDKVY